MSYTVLARKYRSQTFDDLVGQGAIATTLKNAISSGRVHHGYLFTGTRGVGKTSAARVLAKALNCSSADQPTPIPCCTCDSCRMIAEGDDIDVIEIDAASNTGVDNIRDLRDNTAYRPARSRFKIYIIDEVHMLSSGAFNALLKTLEEPPSHVKFILATTEIQKVPATIVSRCQRFDFRSIGVDAIAGHLRDVLARENVEADDAVLRRVARLANGSMRDALSLLDQLISFGGGRIAPEILDDVLPVMHDEMIAALVDRVTENDAAGALACVEQSLSSGQTMERFCTMLVEHLRTMMLLNLCGEKTDLVDLPPTLRQSLATQAQRFDGATYVYMIALVEEVRRSVRTSSASRALVDAAVVRLSLAKNFSNIETLIGQVSGGQGARTTTPPTASKAPVRESSRSTPPPRSEPARHRTPAFSSPAAARESDTSPPTPEVKTPAPSVTKRMTASATVNSAEESRVRRDRAVQQAMDLFDGTLVNVQRAADAGVGTGATPPSTGEVDGMAEPIAEEQDG